MGFLSIWDNCLFGTSVYSGQGLWVCNKSGVREPIHQSGPTHGLWAVASLDLPRQHLQEGNDSTEEGIDDYSETPTGLSSHPSVLPLLPLSLLYPDLSF